MTARQGAYLKMVDIVAWRLIGSGWTKSEKLSIKYFREPFDQKHLKDYLAWL